MKKIVLFLLISVCFAACVQTKYIPVETIKTEYKSLFQRDSIYFKDSIYIRERGDTVFVDKYRYVYRDRFLNDTTLRIDSVSVPYPVKGDTIIEYKRDVFWWIGLAAIIIVLVYFVLWVRRKIV
jgi:hypothetical protein